jgi:hypothetical protein
MHDMLDMLDISILHSDMHYRALKLPFRPYNQH